MLILIINLLKKFPLVQFEVIMSFHGSNHVFFNSLSHILKFILQLCFLLFLYYNNNNDFFHSLAYCDSVEDITKNNEATGNAPTTVKEDDNNKRKYYIMGIALLALAASLCYYKSDLCGFANLNNLSNSFNSDDHGGSNAFPTHMSKEETVNFVANFNLPLDEKVYTIAHSIIKNQSLFEYIPSSTLLSHIELIMSSYYLKKSSQLSIEELVNPVKVPRHFNVPELQGLEEQLSPLSSTSVESIINDSPNIVLTTLIHLFAVAPYIANFFQSPESLVSIYCQLNATTVDNMILLFNNLHNKGILEYALRLLVDMCCDLTFMAEKYPKLVNNPQWLPPNSEDVLRVFHHILLSNNEKDMLDHYKNFHALFFSGG